MIGCVILLIISLLVNVRRILEYLNRPAEPNIFSRLHEMDEQISRERQRERHLRMKNLQRSVQSLRDRLKYRLQQQHGSPGKIIDQVFEEWLSNWDNEWED